MKEDKSFFPIATGFLVGFKSGDKNEKEEDLYHILLITNKHVLADKNEVWLRFNKEGISAVSYSLYLLGKDGKPNWLAHSNPKVDVAAVVILVDKLIKDGIKFRFLPEDIFAKVETMQNLGISQGDGVFVLGFPMGIRGVERNYVIVRGGTIARLDDEIIRTENIYLIDSFVFPGNSGGPVILKPETTSIEGTKPVTGAHLIGVVSGYVLYQEIAYNLQTNPPEPRITFTHNSGLARVVPLDFIYDIFEDLKAKGKTAQNEKEQTVLEGELETVSTTR